MGSGMHRQSRSAGFPSVAPGGLGFRGPNTAASPIEPEHFLRTLGDRLPKAVLYQAVHHADGRYELSYVSRAVEDLTGRSVAHVLEHPEAFTDPILDEDKPAFWAAIEHSLRTLAPFDHVCRLRAASGGVRWCHFRSNVRAEDNGTIVCEGIAIDVTDVKNTDAALKEAQIRDEVNRLELARAARLSVLGEIGASLVHEVNQPLASIVGNAQAARRFGASRTAVPPMLDQILDDIVSQGKRAAEVLRRLRTWIDGHPAAREPVSIEQIIADVDPLVRSELVAREVRLDVDLPTPLPPVLCDRVQLQQVLVNLMLNAVAAMHDRPIGERVIRLSASATTDELIVRMADSGTGIAPEHLDKLFDAFFTTKPRGLGMGLRICASIVRAHSGRIWGENNERGGATLSFALPLAQASR